LFGMCFAAFRDRAPRNRVTLSVLCAGLGAYAPVFVGEIGASHNDNLVGLVVLSSLWLFVRAIAENGTLAGRAQRGSLIVAAMVMGAGAGLKLTMMVHALAMIPALLVVESGWKSRGRVLAIGSAAFVAGFLITNGYWMTRLWVEFQNPFFPFGNHIFQSVWADPRSYADRSMMPTNVLFALLMPMVIAGSNAYTALQGGIRDMRYAIVYVLVVLFVLRALYRWIRERGRSGTPAPSMPAQDRYLLVFFAVSFIAWEASFNIIRYTVCLEAIAPLLIVMIISDLWRNAVVRAALIASAFVLTATMMRTFKQERIPWGTSFWQLQVPAVPDPQSAIIIIANSRPLSYFAPHFSPEVRWVGLKNNLTDPARPTEMQEAIQRMLITHRGGMYLLTRAVPDAWLKHDTRVLQGFGLEPVAGSGQPIQSEHSPSGLQLWRLQHSETLSVP
jgi:hypothetical protein